MNYPTDGTMLLLAALVGRCRLDVIDGDAEGPHGRDLNVVSVTAERTR